MQSPLRARRARGTVWTLFLLFSFLGLFGAASCSGGGGGGSGFRFNVRSSRVAVSSATPVVISGRRAAFLGDEATQTNDPNLNRDADATDSVAHVVHLVDGAVSNLRIAVDQFGTSEPIQAEGDRFFFAVDEVQDDFDWNGDMDNADLVLLTWSATDGAGVGGVRFVAELSRAGLRKMLIVSGQLIYASADVPLMPGETNLRALPADSPFGAPTPIGSTDAMNPLTVRLLSEESGLVFCALSELDNTAILNGDADTLDLVLALLDGLAPPGTALVHSVGHAVEDEDVPVAARPKSPGDWLVAFLVNEAAESGFSLNDPADFSPAWLPFTCDASHRDEDTNDDVLFFLHFALWDVDPVGNPPRSTGIAGTDRVVIDAPYVATIAPEGRDGEDSLLGACDLNDDGDDNDRVVRWIEAPAGPMVALTRPVGIDDQMRALTQTPGGTFGLVEFRGRFIAVVDELTDDRDHDGNGNKTGTLVAELSAEPNAAWRFQHAGGGAVGTSWMMERRDRGELLLTVLESVFGGSLNGDGDALDALPAFVDVDPAGLVFPGVARAVQTANAGVVLADGYLLYRIDEAADDSFWNNDDDKMDAVLVRTAVGTGPNRLVASLNHEFRPAVDVSAEAQPFGATFLASESQLGMGQDLNEDGDETDLVLMHFRF